MRSYFAPIEWLSNIINEWISRIYGHSGQNSSERSSMYVLTHSSPLLTRNFANEAILSRELCLKLERELQLSIHTMRTRASYLKAKPEINEDLKQCITDINSQIENMEHLISVWKSFSNISALKSDKVDVRQVFIKALSEYNEFHQTPHPTVEYQINEGLPSGRIDETLLSIAFKSVFFNVFKCAQKKPTHLRVSSQLRSEFDEIELLFQILQRSEAQAHSTWEDNSGLLIVKFSLKAFGAKLKTHADGDMRCLLFSIPTIYKSTNYFDTNREPKVLVSRIPNTLR
jgi:hypothetical protein